MPTHERQSPFRLSGILFGALKLRFSTHDVDSLKNMFVAFREIDNFVDKHVHDPTTFREIVSAIRLTLTGRSTGEEEAVTINISDLNEPLELLQTTLHTLNQEKQALLHPVIQEVFNSWERDVTLQELGFEAQPEQFDQRHAATVLPFFDMAAICLFNQGLSPEDFDRLTKLAAAFAMFDWLDDLDEDLPKSIVHMPPEVLARYNIHSLEDLENMTFLQFIGLTRYVKRELNRHTRDLLTITSWPLEFRLFIAHIMKAASDRCAVMPYTEGVKRLFKRK